MHPDRAETHVLADERATRAYMEQLWAEVMEVYKSGKYTTHFSREMEKTLAEEQTKYQQEDTLAGQIYDFLEKYKGDRVCSKQLYKEALDHSFEEPQKWEIREINEIMNTSIENGELQGWQAYTSTRYYKKYGKQRGWERTFKPKSTTTKPLAKMTIPEFIEARFTSVEDDPDLPF